MVSKRRALKVTECQNPETVGTAMKTVSMYLRAAKTEASDAGLEVDGMANSVSELRDELMSLTGNKVDIMEGDMYKSPFKVFEELSKVYGDLSETTQANITEKLGGKRNANVVSALLENFSVAENALATASNAAGSALTENEKQLESIEGRINIFKSTFESLSKDVVSSGLVKGVVDAGSTILDIIDHIVNSIGTLSTVLTGAGIVKIIKSVA